MEAKVLFTEKEDEKVKCLVCPHKCVISEGAFGACGIRTVRNGELYAINYGEISAIALDPIEKKPLYHFKPSKNILSLGSFGCNMTCSFCQNYQISQNKPKTEFISFDRLLKLIDEADNNIGVAFTYNEPMMWYEYIYDACRKIKEHNSDINVVIVTNGYINEKPLESLLPYIDAMNIDLKAFTNKFYSRICGANLEPVMNTIKICNKICHVEVTTLLVTNENDSPEEAKQIAQFIGSIDKNIPLHFSRYFPTYNMKNEATDTDILISAKHIAKDFLKYVYIGNVSGVDNNTYCPSCNTPIILRRGYDVKVLMNGNRCSQCGEKINIIF